MLSYYYRYMDLMSMNINDLSTLINQAEVELTQSHQLLESFKLAWDKTPEHPLDDPDTIRAIQLVLQYRLDTQSALYQLNKLQQYLLQLLGIEPLHSAEFNIERMAFALGSDELKQTLSMLNHLIDSLLRIISQSQKQQILDKKHSLEQLKNRKFIDVILKVIDKQKIFTAKLGEVQLILENIGGAPHPGVIYDHIAALEGPVSRFSQALQHGLILSGGIYQQLQQKQNLKPYLEDTLLKVEQPLQNFHYSPEQQRLFKPGLENNRIQSLEARATEKRLGNFFNR